MSGWDQSPVVGARVQFGVDLAVTDADGHASAGGRDIREEAIDIDARGFLQRKTRVERSEISLWPAASPSEMDAISSMVFSRDGAGAVLVNPTASATLVLAFPEPERRRLEDAFRAAAAEVNEVMQEPLFAVLGSGVAGEGAVWTIALADGRQGCLVDQWPGFCLPAQWERLDPAMAWVTREALNRPETPLRMLASAQVIGPNLVPGLLNPETPGATTLSLLEKQVLRMLPQRRGRCVAWPDNDRESC